MSRRRELSDAAVVSRSWGMAVATLVSRITGFGRIVLLAAILGAALSSAFAVANQLPNLIAALVLEATFTAIFVPVLARAERDDTDGGVAFVRRLVTLATAVLLAVTVVSVAAAPLLVRMMLGQHPQVSEPLTTAFAYLLVPQVLFYGLSSVFMAILNNRNVFGPPAWAPVVNNVVAIATLVVYLAVPGELSLHPVQMGNAKLLVLSIGTTLGVVAQTVVLLVAIGREHISLRPLWGIDDRLKRFAAMATAMVLYVLISQIGLVVTNQIASAAAASGPAIYNYAWLVLMLPFGMIGVTVLTVVMPRLSRNAADDDIPAVLADFSLATRLTLITLIPTIAAMTVGGPALGSALFAYGKFGDVDAGYLGAAITLSAFTLAPYALVLLQLRVFYAREQPWTPIAIIVVITAVKIGASVLAPQLTDNDDLVAAYLGAANGLGFLAGAIIGYYLLRRALRPVGGHLIDLAVVRTILVTVAASLLAGLVAYMVDRLLGLEHLTDYGGPGSLLRLTVLGVIMAPIVAAVMLGAQVPEAEAALAAVQRRLANVKAGSADQTVVSDPQPDRPQATYPGQRNSFRSGGGKRKGPEVTDKHSESFLSGAAPTSDFAGDLVPGAGIANGRYRLLVAHGGTPVLQFWQALDTALDRQVALTFVDPNRVLADEQLQEILSRTLRLSHIETPGLARILDVVNTGAGGLVVAEWIRGGSLQEVADTAPSSAGAARAMQSLAAAADTAHHAGVALSLDHPGRVRVSIEGDVALAFPATMTDANPEDDLRGIGAALYALLVNRWPLPESEAASDLAAAERDSAGQVREPRDINPDIPFQISTATFHAVQSDGAIRSAASLLNLLEQATAVADRTNLDGPIDESRPPAAPGRARVAAVPDGETYHRRRRALMVGVGVGAVILVVALVVLASALNHIFGDVTSDFEREGLGLNSPASDSSEPASATPGTTVEPLRATVFSPGGDADAPGQAEKAVDGNRGTAWPTDTYQDPVPFPNFKSGVGLMLQLPKPTVVGTVGIDLPSTGTKVEIRSSSTPKPAKLNDTTVLTKAKPLHPGHNTISVDTSSPTSNLLVWISALGTIDGESRTAISEITVEAAE